MINFFKVELEESPFKFRFNFVLKYGVVEFTWEVWEKGEFYEGDTWGRLKRGLDGLKEDRIRKPIFRNYDDLKGILKEALDMYEDFKRELLAIYNDFDNVLD